jgi:hypothetical protein
MDLLQSLSIHLKDLRQGDLKNTTDLIRSLKQVFETSAFRIFIGRTKDRVFAPISVTFFKQSVYDHALSKFDVNGDIFVDTGIDVLVPLRLEIPKPGTVSPSVAAAYDAMSKFRTPEMIVEKLLADKGLTEYLKVEQVIDKASQFRKWTICVTMPQDNKDYKELHKNLCDAFVTKEFCFYVDKHLSVVFVTFFSQIALTLARNYNNVFERPEKLPEFNPMSSYLAAIKCFTQG